jgi:hypothetical protein
VSVRTGEVELVAGSADDVVVPLFGGTAADPGADAPADLTGWTGRLEVRYAPFHPLLLAAWSTAPAAGEGLLRFEDSSAVLVMSVEMAAASLTWPWRLALFDLALRAPAGQDRRPARPIRGIMRVIPPITATL